MVKLALATVLLGIVWLTVWHGSGLWTAWKTIPPPVAGEGVEESTVKLDQSRTDAGAVFPSIRVLRPQPMEAASASPLVIVYLPGWGGRATDNETLLRRLVLAGHTVLAVDDIAHQKGSLQEAEEDRTLRSISIETAQSKGFSELDRIGIGRAGLAARAITKLLDELKKSDAQSTRTLLSSLGTKPRFVAIGFSFGGAVAHELLHENDEVLGAINLDGWSFRKDAGIAVKIQKPYLVFNSTNALPIRLPFGLSRSIARWRAAFDHEELALKRQARDLEQTAGQLVTIKGTLHSDFSDAVYGGMRWRQWRPWHAPLAHPANVRVAIDQHVLKFLAELNGRTDPDEQKE